MAGRPRTKSRFINGESNHKRFSLYMKPETWTKFDLITRRMNVVKNDVMEELCEAWIQEQLAANPELLEFVEKEISKAKTEPTPPAVIPTVHLGKVTL